MQATMAERMDRLPKQFFANLVARVNERIRAGHDVINLGQGNPDLPTPTHIVEALRQAALDPKTHRYSPFTGLPTLKRAVAEFYDREYGVKLDPEREVAILFGGKTGLVELSEIYLNPGDVALVPDPGYPDYLSGIALAGGEMVPYPIVAENAYRPDLSGVTEAQWQRAKLWFLNYPNNPTGAAVDLACFEEAVSIASARGVILVHDFAYGAIGYDGFRPPSFLMTPGAKETGIEIYTMSKTYNMAGWRLAFAVGHPDVIAAINLMQDHYYVSVFPAVQLAGVAALTGPQDCVRELVATYQARRDAFLGELAERGVNVPAPKGSFFVWMPVPQGFTSASFADHLLERANVMVAPGIGFGGHGEGYVRIGLLDGVDRLREAARRIASVL
ncbi:aminotransferase class I/II-fold pyridoxal phosphate-dependent enzyme [Alicyclobacillus sp.]|uniref:aminotransferase class I/II-fold pyridoxal phosphate-dependent enzyme n=1 Tax=Alicyclobacillus sp. TaxID=61169 RepID=UPI0025B82EA7|nr:aminotransferase class I/II-fold pyridoxal phosphate-dependent enzyme [Alicyclobacillus sp.]MCL6515439.1 aminotransferase class I/II-fold pyridoxal phosphate-dependent enzyme [Alicyclobacillus sp.]